MEKEENGKEEKGKEEKAKDGKGGRADGVRGNTKATDGQMDGLIDRKRRDGDLIVSNRRRE